MSGLRSADMDRTVGVVDLTVVMPGDRPIAQLYIESRTAFKAVRDRDRQPALRKLLEFRNRRATVKNLDNPRTIPARSIKSYARSQLFLVDLLKAVLPQCDRVGSAAVNWIARNSPQANRYSRRTRTETCYLQIYEIF
jgi:hypothetical protein